MNKLKRLAASNYSPIRRKKKRCLKNYTAEQRRAYEYRRNLRNVRRWRKTPKGRYLEQRRNALRRRVAWEFTFESWWQMWEASGRWRQRGKAKGKYVMARNGDCGPYSPSNCRIIKLEVNTAERNRNEIDRQIYERENL